MYFAPDATVIFTEISHRVSIILENVGETRMTDDQSSDQRVKRFPRVLLLLLFTSVYLIIARDEKMSGLILTYVEFAWIVFLGKEDGSRTVRDPTLDSSSRQSQRQSQRRK